MIATGTQAPPYQPTFSSNKYLRQDPTVFELCPKTLPKALCTSRFFAKDITNQSAKRRFSRPMSCESRRFDSRPGWYGTQNVESAVQFDGLSKQRFFARRPVLINGDLSNPDCRFAATLIGL